MRAWLRNVLLWVTRGWMTIAISTPLGRFFCETIAERMTVRTKAAEYHGTRLILHVPNAVSRFRVNTLATKEPETLEWIESLPAASVLWDVGANIGLYSCFAARLGLRVFAFEPSVFNLEWLARNVHANDLVDRVTLVPLPLSDRTQLNRLNMSTTQWGGALSSFGQSYGHDGKKIAKAFEFATIGCSMSDAVELLNIPAPDFLKLDVDGIEHLILRGAGDVLKSVRSLMVEIDETFAEQETLCRHFLTNAGFTMKEKRRSDVITGAEHLRTFNQLWVREE